MRGLSALVLLLLAPAGARAAVTLEAGEPVPGHVHLVAAADPPATDLRVVEQTQAGEVEVARGGEAQVPWTCRTTRTFAAIGGGERSAPLVVTTPSCEKRIELEAPRTVGLGENLHVTLFDRWHQGDLQADVCALAPGEDEVCSPIDLPADQWIAHAVFPAPTAGKWRIEARGPAQRVARTLLVVRERYPRGRPTILTTGDSMMLSTRDGLRRRLRGVARMVDDTYVGSGITRPFVIDWLTLPAQQVRGYRPDATVITVGMMDGRPIDGFGCCGPDWVAAYAQRVRTIMRTYLRRGRGAVVWLNVPLQKSPDRLPNTRAVNTAYAMAAAGLARVKVVDLASRFTPGDAYRSTMRVDGRLRRVREKDGVHFNRLGGRIVARIATRALRDLGIRVSGRAAAPR